MPVEDIEVHEKVRKTDFRAGCYNREPARPGYWAPNRVYRPDGSYTMSETWVEHTASPDCRQVGHRVGMDWFDLPECVGCKAQRDWQYINTSRERI